MHHLRGTPVRFLSARRRHPAAKPLMLLFALFLVGALYSAVAPATKVAADTGNSQQVAEGKALFAVGCASCHGLNGEGQTTEHDPGPAAGRRRRRRGGLPGQHRPDADGAAGGAGPGQAERSTPRRRSRPSPPTSPASAPARPSPPKRNSTCRRSPRRRSPAVANCSGPTARPATTSRARGGALPGGKYAPSLIGRQQQAPVGSHGHRPAADAGLLRRGAAARGQAGRSSPT